MKRLVSLILALIMVFALAACGSSATPTAAPAADNSAASADAAAADTAYAYPEMSFTVAHDIAEAHPTHAGVVKWKELLEEATGGKITLQIYPNAVLGSTDSQITQCLEGSLDCVVIGGFSLLASRGNPAATIEMMPYLFESNQSAMKALDGDFGTWVDEEVVQAAGLKAMCYMCNGLRHIASNNPINVPTDMKGQKFRASNVSLLVEFFEACDSAAVPMAFTEVYTALQQHTIDGFENPAAVINSNKFDEVCAYLNLTGHSFTTYIPCFNLDKFSKLDPEVQQILLDTAKEAAEYQREVIYEYEENSIKELADRGMIINDNVDKTAFREAVQPVWDKYIAEYGDDVLKLAEEGQK